MKWQCKEKHQWSNSLNHVKNRNQWCPKCGTENASKKTKLQNGLEIAKRISEKYNGKCLSKKYVNNKTKMLWECKERHQWHANLSNIKNHNKWCPKCGIKRNAISRKLKNGLCIAQQISFKRGGRCLSIEYINNHTKMLWKCSQKHQWNARLADIKNQNN